MSTWPPPYQIRRSRRARNIGLSVTSEKGVEIVLPPRVSIEAGIEFLNSKRAWIEKHLLSIAEETCDEKHFPTELQLTSLNQQFPIRYHHISHSKRVFLRVLNNRLVFTGSMQKFEACLPAFNPWLRRLAKTYLPRWLSEISEEIQLPYNRVSVRTQKTLWGSCTYEKNISLNDRLLFLPYELVRYVLIHELCHTVYFGHGRRFWQLVKRFDPSYSTNERSLRNVSDYIPSYFRA